MNISTSHETSVPRSSDMWSLAPGAPIARDAQRMLIAVASSCGDRVDSDFENADAFVLYEKTPRGTAYIGRQPCRMACNGADATARSRLLADCDMVLCTGIGEACRQMLTTLGIHCVAGYAGAAVGDAVSACEPVTAQA